LFIEKIAKECFIENDILWRRLKRDDYPPRTVLVVPLSLTEQLVREAHGSLLTGHNGITKTKERLLESYYWPSMEHEITAHIKSCENCQSHRKDDRPKPNFLSPLPQCSAPNQRVHMDLFGPLKTSESGKKYVMCCTDAFTKYCEIVALPNKEASTVALATFNKWICRFGTPLEFVTDGGKEFVNKLSEELFKILKVEHSVTSPYHPQCNAQAEVANKTIAKYLSRVVNQQTLDWELYIPPLMFSYNTSLHRSIKATPYFLTYGMDARLPNFPAPDIRRFYGENEAHDHIQKLQLCRQIAVEENLKVTQKAQNYHNSQSEQHKYIKGQLVWLDVKNFLGKNRKLASNWEGPFPITRVFEHGVVDIFKNNRHHRVNVDRLKPYLAKDGMQVRNVMIPENETNHLKDKEIIFENENVLAKTRKFIPVQQKVTQQARKEYTIDNEFDDLYPETRGGVNLAPQNEVIYPPPQILQQNEQIITQPARQRGRPRVIRENIQPPTQSNNTLPQNEVNLRTPRRSQIQLENILPASQNVREGQRLTRAQAKLVERAQLPTNLAVNLIKVINSWAIANSLLKSEKNIDLLTKKSELEKQLKQFKSEVKTKTIKNNLSVNSLDELGQIKSDKSVRTNRKRRFLEQLPPATRNLILTGDPYCSFDPVVYREILTSTPQQLPPVVQQQFDYLLPDNQDPGPDPELDPESDPEPEVLPEEQADDWETPPENEERSSESSDQEVILQQVRRNSFGEVAGEQSGWAQQDYPVGPGFVASPHHQFKEQSFRSQPDEPSSSSSSGSSPKETPYKNEAENPDQLFDRFDQVLRTLGPASPLPQQLPTLRTPRARSADSAAAWENNQLYASPSGSSRGQPQVRGVPLGRGLARTPPTRPMVPYSSVVIRGGSPILPPSEADFMHRPLTPADRARERENRGLTAPPQGATARSPPADQTRRSTMTMRTPPQPIPTASPPGAPQRVRVWAAHQVPPPPAGAGYRHLSPGQILRPATLVTTTRPPTTTTTTTTTTRTSKGDSPLTKLFSRK
jgi:Integrase zinc binding domain/Integrase core domain